jgi:hypothetical protein
LIIDSWKRRTPNHQLSIINNHLIRCVKLAVAGPKFACGGVKPPGRTFFSVGTDIGIIDACHRITAVADANEGIVGKTLEIMKSSIISRRGHILDKIHV